MKFFYLLLFTLVSPFGNMVKGFVLNENGPKRIRSTTGHLYVIDSATGSQERLKLRHVTSPDENRLLKLDLPSHGQSLDMKLKQGSVWSHHSTVVIRDGDSTKTVPVDIDHSCYLVGPVTSHSGIASLSYCNGVSGIIQTNSTHYIIEDPRPYNESSVTDWDADFDLSPVNVKLLTVDDQLDLTDVLNDQDGGDISDTSDAVFVTDVKPGDLDPDLAKELGLFDMDLELKGDDDDFKETMKKSIPSVTAEIGIYIDANFARYLNQKGIDRIKRVVDWIIKKWNVVKQVYSDKSLIGADFNIVVKHLELWKQNPDFYASIAASDNMGTHLRAFCRNTGQQGLDHKVLYTKDNGGKKVGLSYVGGVCKPKVKCSVVKSKDSRVFIELHEFGHNLGFKHEPRIRGCNWPFGFMGWNGGGFKDCYRPLLLQYLRHPSRRCLYEQGVEESEVLVHKEGKYVEADSSIVDQLD